MKLTTKLTEWTMVTHVDAEGSPVYGFDHAGQMLIEISGPYRVMSELDAPVWDHDDGTRQDEQPDGWVMPVHAQLGAVRLNADNEWAPATKTATAGSSGSVMSTMTAPVMMLAPLAVALWCSLTAPSSS